MTVPRWARRGASPVVDVFWTLGQFALLVVELATDAVAWLHRRWETR